jgi:hypothetical protein
VASVACFIGLRHLLLQRSDVGLRAELVAMTQSCDKGQAPKSPGKSRTSCTAHALIEAEGYGEATVMGEEER